MKYEIGKVVVINIRRADASGMAIGLFQTIGIIKDYDAENKIYTIHCLEYDNAEVHIHEYDIVCPYIKKIMNGTNKTSLKKVTKETFFTKLRKTFNCIYRIWYEYNN